MAQEGTLGEFSLLYAIIDCDFNVESIESGSLADFTINCANMFTASWQSTFP